MDEDEKVGSIQQIFMYVVGSVIVAGILGAVPFAMSVSSRLSSIEQRLTQQDIFAAKLDRLESSMTDMRIKFAERQGGTP